MPQWYHLAYSILVPVLQTHCQNKSTLPLWGQSLSRAVTSKGHLNQVFEYLAGQSSCFVKTSLGTRPHREWRTDIAFTVLLKDIFLSKICIELIFGQLINLLLWCSLLELCEVFFCNFIFCLNCIPWSWCGRIKKMHNNLQNPGLSGEVLNSNCET